MSNRQFNIAGRQIGGGAPCFIIAELSANHAGQKDVALETVRAAKRAGADAIKLQTYRADTITLDTDSKDFVIKQGTVWDGRKLFDLYEEAFLPWEWHKEIFELAEKEGLICFSSPFDPTAVDLLESLDAPAYKIASFEITDIPLIRLTASKGKPIIISTGIANKDDIDLAVATCLEAGNHDIALLKCTSSYPAPVHEANLNMIRELAERYNVVTGLSDHTTGTVVPTVSVALGGSIIEKHFILDKSLGGPDAGFSLDPAEFADMVDQVRAAESSLGVVNYDLTEKATRSREFSRSLYVAEEVKAGDKITKTNVRSVRPGFGMHPKHLEEIVGKTFSQDCEKGTRMDWPLIAE